MTDFWLLPTLYLLVVYVHLRQSRSLLHARVTATHHSRQIVSYKVSMFSSLCTHDHIGRTLISHFLLHAFRRFLWTNALYFTCPHQVFGAVDTCVKFLTSFQQWLCRQCDRAITMLYSICALTSATFEQNFNQYYLITINPRMVFAYVVWNMLTDLQFLLLVSWRA